MQVSTGPTADVRSSLSGRITDARRAIFIELRERGMSAVVAKSEITLTKSIPGRRGRHSWQVNAFMANGGRNPIFILADITIGDFVEVYFPPKEQRLHVKLAVLHNILTPYSLTDASSISPTDEIFFSTPSLAVVTSTKARQNFAKAVYDVAKESDQPIHKVSALKAMEQLFVSLAAAGKIEKSYAEKRFDKYDKISARIWRGGTPGEQINSFILAWNLLASATGITK